MADIWKRSGSTGGVATTSASAALPLPLDTSSPDSTYFRTKLRVAVLGANPVRIRLGNSSVGAADSTDEGYCSTLTEYIDRNNATHYSIIAIGGSSDYSISAGEVV